MRCCHGITQGHLGVFRARERRNKVHKDDSFDMVDVAMAMRRLTSLKLLLLLAVVLPRYVKLSVVVTGCVPMSVDGGVGIHGLKD